MPSMIDLIRAAAVPANLVQSAAKGSLSIPAPEMIEILVYLAASSPVFGEQAKLTLAHYDEKSSLAIAANPQSPKEVLDYLVSPKNFRPALLPALLANPAIAETALAALAAAAPGESVSGILKNPRAQRSFAILRALNSNPNLSEPQAGELRNLLAPEPEATDHSTEPVLGKAEEKLLDQEVTAYLTEHAAEIAVEEKPFQPIGGIHESLLNDAQPGAAPQPELAAATAAGASSGKPAVTVVKKAAATPGRGSALQKISTMDVKGRIQLAMKGNKEERSILIRDGTKLVALGVLESPKISDSEAEMFASQKNVLESVLRGISMKRRFIKNYNVMRNLVANPRTPTDVSLGLMKNLHINDLKTVAGSKDVSETIRKLALKMYKQKKNPAKTM